MRTLTLVVNPEAGHGSGRLLTPRLEAGLTQAGIQPRIVLARSAEHAAQACSEAVASATGGLAVVGGDGMAHIGLNAAARSGVPFGILPAGTGNDFARSLGIRHWRDGLAAIVRDSTCAVDLAEITGALYAGTRRYVGCVVSTGFDERVNFRANNAGLDLGALSYLGAVLAELRAFRPLRYRLVIDGQERELDAMLVAVANAGYFGGGIRIAPGFDLTDGLLDVTIVHPVSRGRLLTLFPRLRGRNFVKHPALEYLRATSVVVDGPGLHGMADGEPLGRPPLTCTAAPGALLAYADPTFGAGGGA
ncbi:MAG TPA: diacylglycerol kinase family protein [Propioniciclava sp.]|jgi:diacylglycerol kinase (ATP)|uniref:diacylglycerol/lipid kinase family protein n=1 Tax=Propioniciclava sp. TaxID=2038686 RepID=UPI002BABD5AA|nr:diacylglycerol kinase family protein [Propioniciclava sp.]HRL48404.1 diacylglycerol kinase family protein [Propioniciclava sp.]HRL80020.1 diacylglycerol kinase family protein [Propioniciclava sp.]